MAELNPTAEITVQYVNAPKQGKKFGSIKSSEGDYYGAPPSLLRFFKAGEVCTIEYKDDGRWKTLVKKIGTTAAPPLAPPPRQRTDPADTENMFINGWGQKFIEAGKIDLTVTDIAQAVQIIREGYRRGSIKPPNSDFGDQVGY